MQFDICSFDLIKKKADSLKSFILFFQKGYWKAV